MKTDFPLSTDWSLLQMENIRGWLVPLSQISQTRELTLLAFKIRQAATSITDFDQARVLADHELSDEEEAPVISKVLSSKPSLPLQMQTRSSRPPRSSHPPRASATNEESVFEETSAPPPGPPIRVKQSTRAKPASGEAEDSSEVHFPSKASVYIFLLFLVP